MKQFFSRILVGFVLAVCLTIVLTGCGGSVNFKPNVSSVGVWWWDHTLGDEYLEFAANNGVTEIYYSVPPKLLDGYAKSFILKANQKNIKVYYLLGDYQWIHDDTTFVSAMERYMAYQSQTDGGGRFAGVHLDIEPHQDPNWKTSRAELLQKYIDFVVQSTFRYGAMDFDIPAWLNDTVIYNGIQTQLYQAVITETNRVFVMSYRDSAEKMVQFSTVLDQIEFAKMLNKPIFLCADSDSPDEDGVTISFKNKGKAGMYEELNQLKDLTNYENLGISIHHIQSWYELKG